MLRLSFLAQYYGHLTQHSTTRFSSRASASLVWKTPPDIKAQAPKPCSTTSKRTISLRCRKGRTAGTTTSFGPLELLDSPTSVRAFAAPLRDEQADNLTFMQSLA